MSALQSPIMSAKAPAIRLPYPYFTAYHIQQVRSDASPQSFWLALCSPQPTSDSLPPIPLHHDSLVFTEPAHSPSPPPPDSDNTAFARARRDLHITLNWASASTPTISQAWLVFYALFTLRHTQETFRLTLSGLSSNILRDELLAVGLAVHHPSPWPLNAPAPPESNPHDSELLIPRSSFWQGAGSPFGPRAAWVADPAQSIHRQNLTTFPLRPLEYQQTSLFPSPRVYARHPVRPAKPAPGSAVYSRFIPHLNEHFSIIAVDWQDPHHLALFHKWQNDPRVSQGWNEEGTLEHHREYLRRQHFDPHQIALFGKFNEDFFGYFEVYWAKEDHMGAYYEAQDYDRGRHSLVGELRFRGPHRVRAWWSGIMHYIFLDEPRTMRIVGEPKASNKTVVGYDAEHGFHVEKFIDLPHKRSALAMISREKFFQMCPLHWGGERGFGGEKEKVNSRL